MWRISPYEGIYIYENGTEVSVTAIESFSTDGTFFNHWLLDGALITGNNPLPLIMDRDHDLTAVFAGSPAVYHTSESTPIPTPTPKPTPASKPTPTPTPTPTPSPTASPSPSPSPTPFSAQEAFPIATVIVVSTVAVVAVGAGLARVQKPTKKHFSPLNSSQNH